MPQPPKWEDTLPVTPAATAVPKWEDTTPVTSITAAAPKWEDTTPVDEKDFLESAWIGLKTELAPTFVSKEEYLGDKNLAGNIVGNLGGVLTAMAGTAAAGAAIGSVVPGVGTAVGAIAAPIAYAIYSGLGYEDLRARAAGQEFNPARAAVNIGLQVNPLIKHGSKLSKAMRLLGQSATEGATEASYGGNKYDVGAAMIGGALAMAFNPLKRSNASPKEIAGYAELLEETPSAIENTLKRMDDTNFDMDHKLIDAVKSEEMAPDSLEIGFRRWITGMSDDVADVDLNRKTNKVIKNLTPEKLKDDFEDYTFSKYQQEEVAKVFDSKVGEITKDPIIPVFSKIQDPRHLAKSVDDKVGTTFEEAIDGISQADINFRNGTASLINNANKVVREMDAEGVDFNKLGRILDGTEEATGKYVQYRDQFRELYDDAGKRLEALGYDMGRLENYLNMQALETPDLYNALRKSYTKLAKEADNIDLFAVKGDLLTTRLNDDQIQLFEDVRTMAERSLGREIKSNSDFNKALKTILDPTKDRDKYLNEVGAAFERKGKMPEEFRNFDARTNFLRYINSNIRTAYMDNALKKMKSNVDTLKALDMDKSSRYWTKYLQHQMGMDTEGSIKAHINSLMNSKRAEWRRIAEAEGKDYHTKEFLADFGNWATSLVYPNFLGSNVKAPIRNMTQTITLTAPHLKGGFGYKIVKDGWMDMLKGTGKTGDFLRKHNIAADDSVIQDAVVELGQALRRRGALGKMGKYSDALGQKLMWAYTKSDEVNRRITYGAGQSWAKRLMKQDKDALKSLQAAPAHIKARAKRALIRKDEAELGDLLGKHLVSETQFHYGKTQMHELGREGGRLLSMFTKWPAMTLSDTVYNLQKGNYGQVLRKFGTPLALLHGAQMLRESAAADDPTLKYVLGNDLRSWAPAASMDPRNFDVFGGPVQRAALSGIDLGGRLMKGELSPKQAIQGVTKSLAPFSPIPGTPIYNEIDRISKAYEGESLQDKLWNKLGLE